MSNPVVKCVVDTCTHYLPGDHCSAKNIDILHEEEGRMPVDEVQTQCKTFAQRKGLANMLGSMDNVNWGGLAASMFQEGRQITPSVTCTVETCKYWEEGNLCHAEGISVSGRHADECQDTNCETFEES